MAFFMRRCSAPMPEVASTPEDRRTRLEAEIRARLQSICDHMSEEDFSALVTKIALTELRSWNAGSNETREKH
jgi:hypothetical protein